jgi:serine/threonine protein kinase
MLAAVSPTTLNKGATFGGWDKKKYTILATLNAGSYGVVYAARNTRTLSKVAIKQISKSASGADEGAELAILTALRKAESRNLTKLLDSFSDKDFHYIVLEFCTLGDLYEVIAADRVPKDTETLRDLVLQLISAVEACHEVGVYHRDIKPENIFLTIESGKVTKNGDGDVVVKLGDFGLATQSNLSSEIGTGSDRYMAPEQFKADATGVYAPAACDIWALGIVILNTLYSRNPWKMPTADDAIFADFVRDPETLFDHFTDMTRDTFDVVKHALLLDPASRSLARMKEAVMQVAEWSHADEVLSGNISRRASTNFADYEHEGPTAGRAPLRTPSIAATTFLAPNSIKSFPWSTALAGMPVPKEDCRNGLGFAQPATHMPSSSLTGSSWRHVSSKPQHYHMSSIDSGLGTSLASAAHLKHHQASPKYNMRAPLTGVRPIAQDMPHPRAGRSRQQAVASSAPIARVRFPSPGPNKEHLKFGTSWADLVDDDDGDAFSDDDLFFGTGSEHSDALPSLPALPEQESDTASTAGGAGEDLFAFEDDKKTH